MTTYPSPLPPSPALTDEATLEVALDSLLEHLPIESHIDSRSQPPGMLFICH
jgi:hypothetical protein